MLVKKMNEKKFLKLINKDGIESEYEILCAFQSVEYNKHYVIYTDNSDDEDGNLNIFASIYYPDDDSKIETIETEEEWNLIENIIENFMKQGE